MKDCICLPSIFQLGCLKLTYDTSGSHGAQYGEGLHHQGLMMEAASTSETSANFYHTIRRNNPADSNLWFCVFGTQYRTIQT
jgi:hypothetical protein